MASRQVLVARQPIFDRDLKVRAYELLFRDGSGPGAAVDDAELATAKVVLNSFTELGLDRITGEHPAWINVDREFVLHGFAASLPPERVVLEILEDQEIDGELVAALKSLRDSGHRLALDDFRYAPELDPLVGLAHVIKLDVLALGIDGMRAELARLPRGMTVLAEKVETREEFELCAAAGCELFQGYFFCRPEVLATRAVEANRLSLLALLSELQQPDIALTELERTIALDLALSYRLLRYMNSAFFGLRHEVRSIGQALALLGAERLRQWAALSVFASVEDKPAELTVTALIRARFCELSGSPDNGVGSGELFTLGLFSLVDALLDMPMDEVVTKVPFPDDTRSALIAHDGAKGRLIESVAALERGQFDRAEELVPGAASVYTIALEWADRAAAALRESGAPA